jgi:hypothetical protein
MWTYEPLQDVAVTAQVRAPHGAGLVEMRVRSFQPLAPAALQHPATPAADAPSIRVHRVTRGRIPRPSAPAAVRFRDVGAEVERGEIDEHLIAVIPLVGDDFLNHHGVIVRRRGDRFQILGRCGDRVRDRGGVALIGALHGHADDRAGLQIHRVLRLVREVCATVLHLRDARIRIVGMSPLRVSTFLGTLPIEPREVRARRCLDARCLRQARQEVLIRFPRVTPHDAP